MTKIIISTLGKQHETISREGKIYYKCNHAVGHFKKSRVLQGVVTCKNCLRWK